MNEIFAVFFQRDAWNLKIEILSFHPERETLYVAGGGKIADRLEPRHDQIYLSFTGESSEKRKKPNI